VVKVNVRGKSHASRPWARRLRVDMQAYKLGAHQVEGKTLSWTIKVDGHWDASFRQHAGDKDLWAKSFRKHTGTHTVQVIKNGVRQHTYTVRTR